MNTPRVLAVQDLYAVGSDGLTASLPVLSAMGAQVCPLPLTVASQTDAYGAGASVDVSGQAAGFMAAWQTQGLAYDAIYSGALKDKAALGIVQDAINRFKTKETVVVVDPVLGDGGQRYDWLSDDMVLAMQGLVCDATVMTPNLTEACLLSGVPYDQVSGAGMPADMLQMGCAMLTDMGPTQVVVTDIPTDAGQFKVISYDRKTNEFHETVTARAAVTTYGLGNVFTSVLTGALLQGKSLADATEQAATFVATCLQSLADTGSAGKDGLPVVQYLARLH